MAPVPAVYRPIEYFDVRPGVIITFCTASEICSLVFVLACNLVFDIFAKCIDGRELVEPFERPTSVDQDAVTRVAARRALLRRQRRLAHRGPYALDNVQILTHVATRSNRPDDIGWIGDVDIVVDDD